MTSLQNALYLSGTVERLKTTHSLAGDLDISRLEQQYFLGQDGSGSTLEVIHQELGSPPIDPDLIRNRQNIIRILMDGEETVLGELDSVAAATMMTTRFNHEKDPLLVDLLLELHRIVQYAHRLEDVLEKLPKKGDLSIIHQHIEKVVRQADLFSLVNEWERELKSPRIASIDLWHRSIRIDGSTESLGKIEVRELRRGIDEKYKPLFDALLPLFDPFMKELSTVLGFYVALAKYGMELRKQETPVVLPEIDPQRGYCEVKKYYNPLLGGLARNFMEMRRDGRLPKFSSTVVPHDYNLSEKRIQIALGRNAGAKSTWCIGRGGLQLMAQIGSPLPASYGRIGVVPSMGSVFIRQVDIGSGQSVFSQALDSFGQVLDTIGEGGLVILDDATEGTDPENSQNYMDFMLRCLHERRIFASVATQDKRLYLEGVFPEAQYYTTVPGSKEIVRLHPRNRPEHLSWRSVAIGTALEKHLGS